MARSRWAKPEHLAQVIESGGAPAGSQFIRELLEAGLTAQNEARDEERAELKKDQKPNTYFTDAGKCERAIFFRLTGEEVTNALTADSLMNFKIGHAVEDAVGEVLSWATGGQILREVSTEFEVNGHRISGRADFLITVPESRVLIELKKTSSRALGWMVKNQQPGRDEHRKQANLYLHASQTDAKWRIPLPPTKGAATPSFKTVEVPPHDIAYLVYVPADATKGEPIANAFPVPYNPLVAKGDLEFLAQMATLADRGDDPGIPLRIEAQSKKGKAPNFPCGYCSYESRCWG